MSENCVIFWSIDAPFPSMGPPPIGGSLGGFGGRSQGPAYASQNLRVRPNAYANYNYGSGSKNSIRLLIDRHYRVR